MLTITENLSALETVETFLQQWFTVEPFRVTSVGIVRHLEDAPREDVAYILREQKLRRGRRNVDVEKEVLIAFLKSYDLYRLECQVYREREMPLAFDCPLTILEQLTPSEDQVVFAWREQCWQRQRHPLENGDTITFVVDIPVPFIPAGVPVTVKWDASIPVFVDELERCYHVPLWRMYPYSILSAGQTKTST